MHAAAIVSRSNKKRFPSRSPSRLAEDARMWMQCKTQLTAYVAWVNSQLKKKPGAHLVDDLRDDCKDGVALIDLIEVIAGEKLSGTHSAPSTTAEMVQNVDTVLQFMALQKVKMHHITTRDIVEGNLKAVMRLVLALAAHYKPNSVRHSTQHQATHNSISGIAQGAAAALTEARRTATRVGHRHRRRRPREEPPRQSDISQYSDSEDAPDTPHNRSAARSGSNNSSASSSQHRKSASMSRICTSPQLSASQVRQHRHSYTSNLRVVGEGKASPTSSAESSPRASLYLSDPPSSIDAMLHKGGIMMTSCESDTFGDSGVSDVCDNLKEAKQMLVQLHGLLLNGERPEEALGGEASGRLDDGGNPQETISILKARLLHAEEVSESLRNELTNVKKDCLELQGTKTGLQQRLSEQEQQLSETRATVTSLELRLAQQTAELESAVRSVGERDRALEDMRAEMKRSEVVVRDLKLAKLQGGSRSLSRSPPRGSQARDRLSNQNDIKGNNHVHKPANLTELLYKTHHGLAEKQLADLEAVSQHLEQMRVTAAGPGCEDPRYHGNNSKCLNDLEESIVKLVSGLHQVGLGGGGGVVNDQHHPGVGRRGAGSSRGTSTVRQRGIGSRQHINNTPTANARKQHTIGFGADTSVLSACSVSKSTGRGQVSSPGRGSPGKSQANHTAAGGGKRTPQVSPRASNATHTLNKGVRPKSQMLEGQTTVVYYTSHSSKPSTFVIHKKLGDVRLGDFKCAIDNPSLYHYFFKVYDAEYGSLKEEVFHDDAVLPGFEGKVIAWLEEANGGGTTV